MSLWEFACCMRGFGEFHGAKPARTGSEWTEEEIRNLGLVGFEDGR